MHKKGTYEFMAVGNACHFVLNCVRGRVVWPALIYSYLRSVKCLEAEGIGQLLVPAVGRSFEQPLYRQFDQQL
jgi:hypothetical protein